MASSSSGRGEAAPTAFWIERAVAAADTPRAWATVPSMPARPKGLSLATQAAVAPNPRLQVDSCARDPADFSSCAASGSASQPLGTRNSSYIGNRTGL